jgi:hypothetical protein
LIGSPIIPETLNKEPAASSGVFLIMFGQFTTPQAAGNITRRDLRKLMMLRMKHIALAVIAAFTVNAGAAAGPRGRAARKPRM